MYKVFVVVNPKYGDKMNELEYKSFIKDFIPKESKILNFLIAFIVGGTIGFLAELLVIFLMTGYGLSNTCSSTFVGISIIVIASLFTALGFFDNWVTSLKCGIILPTTGFAHSVTSSALEYKKDGLITGLGSNFFKLAGSVILYGIISAFLLVIVRVIIGV